MLGWVVEQDQISSSSKASSSAQPDLWLEPSKCLSSKPYLWSLTSYVGELEQRSSTVGGLSGDAPGVGCSDGNIGSPLVDGSGWRTTATTFPPPSGTSTMQQKAANHPVRRSSAIMELPFNAQL
nr:hypothetical protein Iba_chr10bCG9860 [Ipomoea batatas]